MPVEYRGGLVRSAPDVRFLSKETRPGYEMRPAIVGFGKAHGSLRISSEETAQAMVDQRIAEHEADPSVKLISLPLAIRALRRYGIEDRYFCTPEEASSDMGTAAGAQALEMAGYGATDVKNLPYATGLQDHMGVPTGTIVMKNLKGNYEAATVDMSGACPGFVHALRTAYTDMTSEYGLGSPQMVIASEPASKGISKDYMKTWILFGDAAGAVVLDMVEVDASLPKATFVYGMDPDMLYDLYVPAGGSRDPTTAETLQQGKNLIKMEDGEKVKEAAIRNMCAIAARLFDKSGLTPEDIDLFVPHQANLEIIKGVRNELGKKYGEIPIEKFMINIQKYGNTSAATVPVAMREAWEEGRLRRGDMVMVLTFGAGLNYAGAILPMDGILEEQSPELSRFLEPELKAA